MRIMQSITDYIMKSILTTHGDMVLRGAAIPERLAGVAVGQVLKSGGVGAKPAWGLPSVPSGEIVLFEKDTVVTGYTLQIDKDDMSVYVTKGSVAGGETGGTDKTGGTWTQPNHLHTGPDHNHKWLDHVSTGDPQHSYQANGSVQNLISNTFGAVEHVEGSATTSEGVYGASEVNLYTTNAGTGNTNGSATANTWRHPGRNFTRQQRN